MHYNFNTMINLLSPWLWNANMALNQPDQPAVWGKQTGNYTFKIVNLEDALWLIVSWPSGSRIAFRLAYSPNDQLNVAKFTETETGITMDIHSVMGRQQVALELQPVLHWSTTLIPAAPLLFPFWPRDIVPLGAESSNRLAEGEVLASQVGTRSGQLYFQLTRPKAGSVFLVSFNSLLKSWGNWVWPWVSLTCCNGFST